MKRVVGRIVAITVAVIVVVGVGLGGSGCNGAGQGGAPLPFRAEDKVVPATLDPLRPAPPPPSLRRMQPQPSRRAPATGPATPQ